MPTFYSGDWAEHAELPLKQKQTIQMNKVCQLEENTPQHIRKKMTEIEHKDWYIAG